MRFAIILVGVLATILALTIDTVYGLWFLCSDLVFVVLFPQLLCVIYFPICNTYGSLTGYIFGLLLRLLGGEPLISLPAVIKFPWYDEASKTQLFPFRTLAMLVCLVTILLVSYLSNYLFKSGMLPKRADVFKCIVNLSDDEMTKRREVGMPAATQDNPAFEAGDEDSSEQKTSRF